MPQQTFTVNHQFQHRSQPSRKSMKGKAARRGGGGPRGDTPVVATTKAKKKARTTSSIIERNRKTEICRNWENGACAFGDKCAFAHGFGDIKHKTLRDLENEGRIPDASKHHAFPCMNWVASGACPYGPGCVFIHDDLVKGEALPRAPCVAKITGTGGGRMFCLSGADNDNGGLFFFPDVSRDIDSIELPADHVRYDVRPGQEFSTAYKLWYSFVSTCINWSSAFIGKANHAKTPTISTSNGITSSTRPMAGMNHTVPSSGTTTAAIRPPATVTAGLSYKDAAAETLISFPRPVAATTRSTTYKDATAAGTASGTATAGFAASYASPVGVSPTAFGEGGVDAWPRPSSSVVKLAGPSLRGVARRSDDDGACIERPLPVFEGLRNGSSARRSDTTASASPGAPASERQTPLASPLADFMPTPPQRTPTAPHHHVTGQDDDLIWFDRGDDDDDHQDNDSYLSCPSSSSSESSASSSVDSYLSCRRTPPPPVPYLPWRPAAQWPHPGLDAGKPALTSSSDEAFPALLYGGCAGTGTLSTADAGSWSSGTSLLGEEEEDDRHRDDAFDPLLLHRFEPSLLSPSQTAAAAVGPPAAGASGRLPVFVELHSSSSCTAAQDNSTGGGSGPSVGYQDDVLRRRSVWFHNNGDGDPLLCGRDPAEDYDVIPAAQATFGADVYLPLAQDFRHPHEYRQHQQQ